MNLPSAGSQSSPPELAQGVGRCQNTGMAIAERFMERLIAAAAQTPLGPDEIRRQFAIFHRDTDGTISETAQFAYDGCRKPASGFKNKRLYVFERAVIARFEKRFSVPTPEGNQLSRRVILGFMYALTKALGPDAFRSFDQSARAVAASVNDGDPTYDPRMHEVVNGAILQMARAFDGEFLAALNDFTELVNSRLTAPKPNSWDLGWELNRGLAIIILDDLFADLRRRFEQGELPLETSQMLAPFFEGLDTARELADRPWLKRKLR